MTASKRYELLEADGRYFDGQSANPREVILSFRERSLIIRALSGEILTHWPLASLRALTGMRDRPMQLVPHIGSDERLAVEDDIMIEAIREVCPDLTHRPTDRRSVRKVAFWGLGAIAAVVLMVFVLIPTLAGQLAQMIPPEREQALGDAVLEQITRALAFAGDDGQAAVRFCDGREGRRALAQMTDRVTRETPIAYDLRVEVLDHPMVNALALPGGRVVLFRGLIDAAESPEEVAGVLAHEIGHVIYRDPTTTTLRAAGTAGIFGLLLGDIFGAGAIAAASDAVLNASYQREAEARADEAAVRMLADAGLPSSPFARFFERLHAEHGDTPLALRYFSSHPELADRATRASAADTIGNGAFRAVLNDRGWIALQGICAEGN